VLKRLGYGLASGAVGTTALNLTTYLDMAWRGRGASEMPAKAATTLGEKVGMRLPADDEEATENRKTALGSLLGFATGLGIGAAYGLVTSGEPESSTVTAGIALGLTAMVATDLPMTALGLTDPREWDAQSWLSDLVPHLVYGICTAGAHKAFTS
jgi:hypothetical protein